MYGINAKRLQIRNEASKQKTGSYVDQLYGWHVRGGLGIKQRFHCSAGSMSPCQKNHDQDCLNLPWCLILEEAKHWQRLCHAAEQPATDSEVVEIEHENWASNPEQQYMDVTCHRLIPGALMFYPVARLM